MFELRRESGGMMKGRRGSGRTSKRDSRSEEDIPR